MIHRPRGRIHHLPGVVVIAWMLLLATAMRAAEPGDVPLHRDAVLHFATVDEGRERLGMRDPFTAELSRFDCQVRLGTADQVGEADVRRLAAAEVVAWTPTDAAKVATAATSLRARLERYRVPLPKTVQLVLTSGREEGEAAYCRYPAIVVPRKVLQGEATGLERLLNHELFHIVSRHDPELRRKLYRLVGFEPCEPIAPPPALRDRKITNPDAPSWDNVIQLNIDERRVAATPVLIASVEQFDPAAGGSLFKYLQFRLLVVESQAPGRWSPKLVDGRPELLKSEGVPDYSRQIGRNTGYIIHPDEVLADNFVHLVMNSGNLPNPELIDKLRAEFSANE